jgi:hypothetical protein
VARGRRRGHQRLRRLLRSQKAELLKRLVCEWHISNNKSYTVSFKEKYIV